jgi:hypothetical protein
LTFLNTSTAGNATFITEGGKVSGAGGATIVFDTGSTAGNALLTTNGGAVSGAFNAETLFRGNAGNATLIANGGSGGGPGALIHFVDASRGGTARVEVFGNGSLDISGHAAPGMTVGSMEGNGRVFLGSRKLTVGGNNQNTNFSGSIQMAEPMAALVARWRRLAQESSFSLAEIPTPEAPSLHAGI